MAWKSKLYSEVWQPKIAVYSKEDENGNVEFNYILLDDIPEKHKIGLPQFVGHNNIIEIDGDIGFKLELWEMFLKYKELNDMKWLVKGRGKNSNIPLTKEELQEIIQGL